MGSGINQKSSIKLTLVAAAKEGKNNNNNNNNLVVTNVQCWNSHALVIPKAGNNNSLKSEDFKNINIIGRRDGGSSNIINITSRNTAVVDSIIISDPLRGRGLQQQEVDLVRDLVVTLNSNGDRELPTTGVSEVEDTTESVSDNQNVNINNGSSSDIVADNDSNMATTEQAAPLIEEVQDLPTTMKPAESYPWA